MSIKTSFLTLSMREQICFAIVLLTIFSLIVILFLSCALSYEILKEDYEVKKLYFYDKFKEYIELCFYFQNFCLLQYEELLKRLQLEMSKFHLKSRKAYNFKSNFDYDPSDLVVDFNPTLHKDNSNNNDILFFFCYNEQEKICETIKNETISNYLPFSSLIFTHDINKVFVIPGYQVPIVKALLLVDVYTNISLSFNGTRIYESIIKRNISCNDDCSNENIRKVLYKYYDDKVRVMMQNNYIRFLYYFSDELFQFKHMFEKVEYEMSQNEEVSIIDANNNKTYYEYAKTIGGYYSSVIFPEDKLSFISYSDNRFFYFESKIIDNYLYFLLSRISDFLDVSFIPLHYENDTIISPELCIMFLIKQIKYQLDIETIKKLFNNIKKGESNISECFFNKNILNEQLNIKDIFLMNSSFFMTVNNAVSEGILDLGNKSYYYFSKYTYPNYNVLKDFRTDYILLDQINFYLFKSFKEPIEYSNYVYILYRNCFLLIIIIIIYIWIICLTVNLIFFYRIIKQITEPIKKLQEAIESTSIKDENLFKYEYDDFINDLFITCKELLSGKIDKNNNEKGLGQFNIISIPKDKQKSIDKNLYQRNIIINNDLMEQLISEQQSTMDYSKNIEVNELYNSITNDVLSMKRVKRRGGKYRSNEIFTLATNREYISDISDNENDSNKNKQNKVNEENNKENYKKLFKISEYLNYNQNKIENNFINIINNVIKDDASNISKISNNININGSLMNKAKLKKPIVRGDSYGKNDENNYSINMLDNNNISYFWYMEAKKKKNHALDYRISNNYEELFMDNNDFQKNQENIKKKNDFKNDNLY